MAGPWKCINVLVKINNGVVGVIQSMEMQIGRNGGVEMHYGSETGRHAIGGKKVTFTASRWFMADSAASTGLFADLCELKQPFSLSGEIVNLNGSQLLLSNCIAYNYKPKFGAPNDTVVEEISGEGTDWTRTIH